MSVVLTADEVGPLAHSPISIKPLTILVGPNNTGKSYVAMLTYAASHSVPFAKPYMASYGRRFLGYRTRVPIPKAIESDLRGWIASDSMTIASVPESVMKEFSNEIQKSLNRYATGLSREIERCFGRTLKQLTKSGPRTKRPSRFEVRHGSPKWSVQVDFSRSSKGAHVLGLPDVRAVSRMALTDSVRRRVHTTREGFEWFEITRALSDACFAEFPRDSYYLPAARSGLLQSHRLLASMIVSRSSLAGIEDIQISKMTGVITDFLGHLLAMDSTSGATRLATVAKLLESDLLHGRIRMTTGAKAQYPEISYETDSGRHQLSATSSMVSELAPVVLFLRYLVDPSEMLIIEEPESHLHPAVQRQFAKVIARLVNAGVTVVITTHSDFFLTQLSNLILAGDVPVGQLQQVGYADEERLERDKVATYLFKPSPTGTRVKYVEISRGAGIDQQGFDEVAEDLYGETVELTRLSEDRELDGASSGS